MDHLPTFGAGDSIHVPYLCTEMYDGEDFFGYPERKGWSLENIKRMIEPDKSTKESASFLQAWTYFGLLHRFFAPWDPSFNFYDFVEGDQHDTRWVTTKRLKDYVFRWHEWQATATEAQKLERLQHVKQCLDFLVNITPRYYNNSPLIRPIAAKRWPLPPEVLLSTVVLGDTLQWAGFQITGVKFNLDWGVSPMLIERMWKSGWCPSQTATLCKGQQLQNLYYASTLGSPSLLRDHQGKGCSETVCHWEQIDQKTYASQHRPGCRGCSFTGPDLQTLRGMIHDGGVPTVSTQELRGSFQMSISKAGEDLPYIAISHVWANGLGNPQDNTLPVCQLHWLQTQVNDVQTSPKSSVQCFWWCDTLCVPVHKRDIQLRKKAIVDMRRIYQNASKVLALDNTLLCVSKDAPLIQLYIRLKLSSWMRRLWTLQEAILPNEVYIQFSDGTRTLNDIAASLRQDQLQTGQYLYMRYIQLSETFFSPFVKTVEGNASHRFTVMWKQMQWRSTSHAADETICLATTMGLDPRPILDILPTDHERRMVKLLQMMKVVPLLLPFQPPPRLQAVGFRWAPASFLNCFRDTSTNPFRVLSGSGEIAPDGDGLIMQRFGFELLHKSNPKLVIGEDFIISPPDHPEISLGVTYKWPQDRTARKPDGTFVVQQPVIVYLAAVPAAGEVAILADIIERDLASATIKIGFIATVFLGLSSQFTYGTKSHQEVTHQARQLSPHQKWLLC